MASRCEVKEERDESNRRGKEIKKVEKGVVGGGKRKEEKSTPVSLKFI